MSLDWAKLPTILLDEAQGILASAGIGDTLQLDEVLVHASVEKTDPAKLRWLEGWLDRQPGVRVKVRTRRRHQTKIRCNACGEEHEQCPDCQADFTKAPEKGVDTALVTDLLTLAWDGAYDLAILVTSDGDFVPAVERVQQRGLKVVNTRWKGLGHNLARSCWASFELNSRVSDLTNHSYKPRS